MKPKKNLKSIKKTSDVDTEKKKLNALIFIDSNVYLDFYEMTKKDITLQFLDKILDYKHQIILSSQVEMEFKKNRQKVLNASYLNFGKINNLSYTVPEIFELPELKDLLDYNKNIASYNDKLLNRFNKMFEDYSKDEVFNKLDILFSTKSEFNLLDYTELHEKIYSLAQKRFNLGYPPRKNGDNTFGDSFNWEWIIHCANISKRDIIIVSRDGDYGRNFNKRSFINDFLKEELKRRLDTDINIVLTFKISDAFELIDSPLSNEMADEEQKIIDLNSIALDNIKASVMFPSWNKYIEMLGRERTQLGPNFYDLGLQAAESQMLALRAIKFEDEILAGAVLKSKENIEKFKE